jgi:opacity protein-like surface antigen
MYKKSLIIVLAILFSSLTIAQEAEVQTVDASKPTNLYTQVNGAFEYQSHKNGSDLYGTRFNVQYAFNPDNLLLVELPFLYNEGTEKFGLSDMRVRYFHAAKRNISERFIAIAPYADITIPSGSVNNGLGADIWSLTGGVVFGYVLTPKIALFPGVGYVHVTDSDKSGIASQNGVNFQTNMSINFSKKTFLFVNPIVTILDRTLWTGELNLNYMVKPSKLKTNIGYYPDFTNDIHTFRIGATIFL